MAGTNQTLRKASQAQWMCETREPYTRRPCDGAEKTAGGGAPTEQRRVLEPPARTGPRPCSPSSGPTATPRAVQLWRRGAGWWAGPGLWSHLHWRAAPQGSGQQTRAASEAGLPWGGEGSSRGQGVGGGLGGEGPQASRSSSRAMVGEAAVSRRRRGRAGLSHVHPLICRVQPIQTAPGREGFMGAGQAYRRTHAEGLVAGLQGACPVGSAPSAMREMKMP